ncbi:nucleoside deaminase [Brachybacterium sp. J153]|uniref:nucleoside deaminase n=1 Tax=Brachybacterium sp. J153 TaxID=3116488 RepID=UPI002E7632BF|nr:nucleoside deaminase [Brachybacterium sp. J153]MEE1619634.1 nucleoside deaminase [Brachybacterium sp. J153]
MDQHASTARSTFGVTMPDWVEEEVAALGAAPSGDSPATRTVLMRLLNRLAERNVREGGGGPFAALVRDGASGEIVAAGVNRVLASGLSSMHAEVTTLSLAQRRRGAWDLGAAGAAPLELWVNARPCVMCYGATMWSGVTRLVIAVDGPEVEELTGFDEGPMPEDWIGRFRERGIEVETDVLREEAVEVLAGYRDLVSAGSATLYNARGTGVHAG